MTKESTLESAPEFWPEPKYNSRRRAYFIGGGTYTESEAVANRVVSSVNAYVKAGHPADEIPQVSFCVEYVRLHGLWRVSLGTWNADLDEDVWSPTSTEAYLIERAVRWEEERIAKETGEHRGLGDPVVLANMEILRRHLDRLDCDDVSGSKAG